MFFNDTATTGVYALSLHDALPICENTRLFSLTYRQWFRQRSSLDLVWRCAVNPGGVQVHADVLSFGEDYGAHAAHERCRSEEHTSELQSLRHLVCRLLLEKKNVRQ